MDIIDIFYNYIVKEAVFGRVDCYFYYNMLFDTIVNDNIVSNSIKYPHTITPTLIIKDKEVFDKLLIEYVNLALDFYDDNNFEKEVIEKYEYNKSRNSKEKTIMTLLWSNATMEDFQNPIGFLQRRINFLKSEIKTDNQEYGYCDILKGNLSVSIEKDKIYNETPYKMVIKLNNNDEEYIFPEIKFGIDNETIYFYAIQNNGNNNNSYSKKVNRILFKIGDGFDQKLDNYENYEEGNLKDVSASFLVALNIAISYFKTKNFNKICVSSILIERWNAKKIAISLDRRLNEVDKNKLLIEQENIQKNITEKFLRTFLRLKFHYDGIDVSSMPFEIDSNLHLNISKELISNNTLLNETNILINEKRFLQK